MVGYIGSLKLDRVSRIASIFYGLLKYFLVDLRHRQYFEDPMLAFLSIVYIDPVEVSRQIRCSLEIG